MKITSILRRIAEIESHRSMQSLHAPSDSKLKVVKKAINNKQNIIYCNLTWKSLRKIVAFIKLGISLNIFS